MFGLTEQHRYYLYDGVADMRKGFDGLSGIVTNKMGSSPIDGSVYIFINRRRDRMKLLLFESSGFILYYKRLEKGTFEFPRSVDGSTYRAIKWETLVLMITGISMKGIHRRKRHSDKESRVCDKSA
jgi:transposase